jgi:hypothetical protein
MSYCSTWTITCARRRVAVVRARVFFRRRIFYGSYGSMFETEANGTGQGGAAIQTQHPAYSNDWSPDGRYLMYAEASGFA